MDTADFAPEHDATQLDRHLLHIARLMYDGGYSVQDVEAFRDQLYVLRTFWHHPVTTLGSVIEAVESIRDNADAVSHVLHEMYPYPESRRVRLVGA